MKQRTFGEQNLVRVLGSNLSGDYTQSFGLIFGSCERVIYVAVGHASANFALNATIASDASGTGAADVTTDIAVGASQVATLEVTPEALTSAKQYLSAKFVRTAGTASLIEIKTALRREGGLTYDAGWVTCRFVS